MKNELETLRAELHKEVDAKIDKFIKPIQQFKKGEWVKLINDYGEQLKKGMVFQIVEPQTESLKCFIVDHVAFGLEDRNYLAPYFNYLVPATPTEVQEALTKQIEKMFPINTKIKTLDGNTIILGSHALLFKNNSIYASSSTGGNNGKLSDMLFKDGLFATPIKTMTIDELAKDFVEYYRNACNNSYEIDFKIYLTKEKSKIIETLNNL